MKFLLALLMGSLVGDDPAKPSLPLRLATFNIHHAEGTDGTLDLKRVAQVVRDADVIAFQEVDVRFAARSQFVDQAAELAKALEKQVAFGGNLINQQGAYGVALVSRFPIIAKRNYPLPRAPGREKAEPRGLLAVTLDVHGQPIRVYVTHLAHDSDADRKLQVDAIRKILASEKGPAILMGDLNFTPQSPHYEHLLEGDEGRSPLLVDAWVKSGKGDGPTIGLTGKSPHRIDYVLVSPDLADGLEESHVDTNTQASDHQPVFTTLKLRPAPAPDPAPTPQ